MPATKSILVVDDDPDIHELLATLLGSGEYHVESAQDGLAGLSRLEHSAYDLVLTDVRMPGLDGLELLHRIHELRPEAKVVVMTAASTPERIIRAMRDQAFGYLSKPFSARALNEVVQRAFSAPVWQDDIEVLSARPAWIALQLRCKIETADRILQFLREMGMDLPPAEREHIGMAFRELLLNAIEHGGQSDPRKKVYLAYVRTNRAIIYYLRDPGAGFSFSNLAHAAVSNPPDAPFEHTEVRDSLGLRPGGFGILLTRNVVDELIYNEKGNEVLLIKYLVTPGA